MIILVNSGSGNLGNYLLNGNDNKRDHEKIKIIDGNFELSQNISNNLKYKDSHFHFILSTKEKLDNEKLESIYEDFKTELLDAYSDDEVNISAVIHNDTDHSHVHVMIPKINLLTNTKLDLYYHKRDVKRFELISDMINDKYNLESPKNTQQTSNDKFKKNTKNWKPDTATIKTKKDKQEFEELLLNHIEDSKDILFSNHNELMGYLENDLNLNISKVGYDYKVDDFYITLQHENSKQRLFSPLFNNGNLKYTLNENGEKIYEKCNFELTKSNQPNTDHSKQRAKNIREKLNKENQKYSQHIKKRVGKSREKARQRDTQNQNELSNFNNINNTTKSKHSGLSTNKNPKTRDYKSKKSIKKSNFTFVDYLGYSSKYHNDLLKVNNLNLIDVAIKYFKFELLKIKKDFGIIKNKNIGQNLFIYKNKENRYNFINPYNQNEKGGVVDFIQNQMLSKYPPSSDLIDKLSKSKFNDNLSQIKKNDLNCIIEDFKNKNLTSSFENIKTQSIYNSKNKEYPSPLIFPDIGLDLHPKY